VESGSGGGADCNTGPTAQRMTAMGATHMKRLLGFSGKNLAVWAMCLAYAAPLHAQPASRIQVAIDVEGVGPAASDGATKLLIEIRKGLEAARDVEIVARGQAHRVIRIIVSSASGVYGASLLVTEQYDRETLMILGIEDDDLAGRMMLPQMVNEHQGFAGSDLAEIARRIVATLDDADGVFGRLRSIKK
jgi:hypothetical protein